MKHSHTGQKRRHRLIWRIMLIFWITTILTIVANIVITKEIMRGEHHRTHLEDVLHRFAREAVSEYQSGGQSALSVWYDTLLKTERFRVVLFDSNNRALAKPDMMRRDFRGPHFPGPKSVGIVGANDQYFTLKLLPSPALYSGWRSPEKLHGIRLGVSFLIIFIGSAWLARSLARPVNSLQEASEKIARGQLDTRLPDWVSKRHDELGLLAKTFDHMAERLEELIERQQQLFRDISHEIRTPLTRQKLAIELARDSDDPGPYLDKLEQQNQQIESLVDQLLSLLKINANESGYLLTELNVIPVMEQVLEQAELELQRKAIKIDMPAAQDFRIRANEALLTRALDNILVNAIKYSPDQSRIAISVREEASWKILQILDQGPGVPPADLRKILQPFYRSDSSRHSESGGFGLGLAIVKGIMEQHGGTLEVKNQANSDSEEDNKGLCVELRFPA